MVLRHLVCVYVFAICIPSYGHTKGVCSDLFLFKNLNTSKQTQSDQRIERWLREGKVLKIQKGTEETTGEFFLVTVQDPNSMKKMLAIFKPNYDGKPSEVRAEEAAYKFDHTFGFNVTPVTVTRELVLRENEKPVEGSLQEAVDIKKWKSAKEFNTLLKNNPDIKNQYYTILLLNHLIFDKDINIQNVQLAASGNLVSIDHEFAFGFMDPFGEMEPLHIRSFPKDLDFRFFLDFYNKISKLKKKEYAKIIAPLVLFTQGYNPKKLKKWQVNRLNWIMGFLMEARESFIIEMQDRLPELRPSDRIFFKPMREVLPYDYFEEK